MKPNQNKRGRGTGKLIGRFDIPEDVVLHVPRIIMMDNTEARIENYEAVLEYDGERICIACKKKEITLCGTHLTIAVITDEEVTVRGDICSVQFG